eukprot:RCo035629
MPELNTARCQVLDYLTQTRALVRDDHVLFSFEYEKGMQMGPAERQLVGQLALQLGFPASDPTTLAQYFTGENAELVDLFPELGFFRDIVFYFKSLMVPTSDALPALSPWTPADAKLGWRWNPKEKAMLVTGFGDKMSCCGYIKEEKEDRKVGATPTKGSGGVWSR